ncbi:MAG: transglycosylase domain-containing protein [Desulfobacterales bacterium]|nr:transglycosylase domain-containing protein [Desulfobacterales bacterium]
MKKTFSFLWAPIVFFRKLCFWTGFVTLFVLFSLSLAVFLFFNFMPDVGKMGFNELRQMARESVYNRLEDKGNVYKWVPVKMINRDLMYSIVMSEDADYFSHNGINYDALINSLAENIKRRQFAFGGSTISQQVVKNIFLDSGKSIIRKIKELCVTRRMEKKFSKNQIIELYLNIAELGPDIFGVNAASHFYFKKPPSKINAAEGAFMALMLPSPRKNHYRLYQNRNISGRWRKKLERILKDMRYNDFISEEQYRYYLNYHYFSGP